MPQNVNIHMQVPTHCPDCGLKIQPRVEQGPDGPVVVINFTHGERAPGPHPYVKRER